MPRLLLAALVLSLTACGGGDDDFDGDVETTGASDPLGQVGALREAAEAMEAAADRPPAEPVDFRTLRDLLPASLDGMERTGIEGASQGAMGFAISQAEATYAAEGAEVTVQVMDYGAVPQAGMMGFGWAFAEVDRETATGYERTVRLGESKGFREYDTAERSGQFSLLVAERFIVQVRGRGVDDDALEAALRAVDLRALAGMRDEGRPAA